MLSIFDTEALQEVGNDPGVVIRSPPAQNKYESLKSAILVSLAASADRQLLRLFT